MEYISETCLFACVSVCLSLCLSMCFCICLYFGQISAGRTHSAAWTCPAPVRRTHGSSTTLQLGTPSSVPAQYTSLQDSSIDDIKARLQLLHHYSDLVYSSWRLLSLVPSHVSAHMHSAAIELFANDVINRSNLAKR